MGLPAKKLGIMVTPLHGHMSDLQGILKWTDGQWHHHQIRHLTCPGGGAFFRARGEAHCEVI